jgi:hypothetical protein
MLTHNYALAINLQYKISRTIKDTSALRDKKSKAPALRATDAHRPYEDPCNSRFRYQCAKALHPLIDQRGYEIREDAAYHNL